MRQFSLDRHRRPRKSVIFDGEANSAGVVPYDYRADDFHNAVQWAAGLELFLLINNPRAGVLHDRSSNGAPYTSYPDLFAVIISRELRAKWLADLPKRPSR